MNDTTSIPVDAFPPQPREDPVARHAQNEVCLQGHLNDALTQILASREPDAVFSLLGSLAAKAIEIALEASKGMPGHVTQLREMTSKTQEEVTGDGPTKHVLRLGFASKADAHRAIKELDGMCREDVHFVPRVGKVVVMPDGSRVIEANSTAQVIDDGAAVYTDPRGVFQAASLHLPKPTLYMLAFGADYDSWRECDADTPGAKPFWNETAMRNYRDERGNVHEALEARRAAARAEKAGS